MVGPRVLAGQKKPRALLRWKWGGQDCLGGISCQNCLFKCSIFANFHLAS